MDCKAIRPDLGAYAIGALDDADAERVAQHLAGCAACRAELAALDAAASLLPSALAAASPLVPPDRLKERLLAAVSAGEDQAPAPVGSGILPAPARSPNHADKANALRHTTAIHTPTSVAGRPLVPFWRRPLAWAGLAAALLLVASLAWGVRLSEALDREKALRNDVADFYGSQQAIVFEVVDSDETTRRVLRPPEGSDFPTRPYGKLFTRADMVHVVAMANRLPVAPAGQTYHLWVELEGRTLHAGVLAPNDEGFAVLVFDADRPGAAFADAWITLQPAESTVPGGETIVVWDQSRE